MPSDDETGKTSAATEEALTEPFMWRLAKWQVEDLIRRAGEAQATRGVKVSPQEIARELIWPEGRVA